LKSFTPIFNETRQRWFLLVLTVFTFFFLLGSRALNEPDEGRYAEVAREMIETGNWLVPHFWYLPHLDKPPMTYWLVAVSMKIFGRNEWAARLPVALAGISGVWAAFLLGGSLGGRRVGFWSALILQSSLLYFVMARMLTTDIFLTAFNVWAMYFFWRSWLILECGDASPLSKAPTCQRTPKFLLWHLTGWAAIAFGFLTKGPIAFAIPLAAFGVLLIFRRKEIVKNKLLFAGLLGGFALFLILAAPWFLAVFQREPGSAHYMILGQAAGHLLGTTIKNRHGNFFYFFGILAVGLLPWTLLLGWLWRRNHWRNLDAKSKDGWLLLNVWGIFTFVLFSFSESKLPAYILPIFPALAILLAWKFFAEARADESAPKIAWRICLASSLLLPAIFPLLLIFIFRDSLPQWLKWQTPIIAALALSIFWLARKWKWQTQIIFTFALALLGFFTTVAEIPLFETTLKANQTLQLLGLALQKNFQPGDAVVCWGKLPQGLPFYSGGAISATDRPFLGGMDLTQVPFEFPGNRERLGNFLLPDENSLAKFLQNKNRVLIVAFGNTMENFQKKHSGIPLHFLARSGQWALFSN
jgi:4-amino-4-deoxy-L-arabinose transferase-like glycosyltransferase